jgi:hypothetical protein
MKLTLPFVHMNLANCDGTSAEVYRYDCNCFSSVRKLMLVVVSDVKCLY